MRPALPHFYAGIGSRNTPDVALEFMRRLGKKLAGYTLRSGAAQGASGRVRPRPVGRPRQ